MWEQPQVLEHHAHRALFGRDGDAARDVVEDDASERDATVVERHEPGERVEQRRLPRRVRAEDRHGLGRAHREGDVEREVAATHAHVRGQRHGASSHRPRSAARTASDTASSTTLNARPASGRVSSAR